MGLETDITDIQSLNRNWPPVSDPRAQGADHIRNIKKAIQLTFPNLKQCLLNDAQFTALGTLTGDGSGTFKIKGTLLVPTVTNWTTQQAVGAKDAEGRYLKPGDADGRYLKPGDADGRYVGKAQGTKDYTPLQAGVQIDSGNIWLSYKGSDGTVKYAFAQQPGDYATNSALNTETTKRTNADTNLQNQINNRVQKTGDTIDWLTITGGSVTTTGYSGNDGVSGGISYATGLTSAKQSGDTPLAIYRFINQNGAGPFATIWLTDNQGNGHELRFGADDRLRTASGNVFALTSELPRTFISAQQGVQTNYKYVIPHNLGRVPDAFWVYLVNVSSDWGYNPGQIAIPSFDDKNNGGFGPLPVTADSWNIFLPMSDAVPLVSRMDPSNGDNQLGDRHSINADSWRFVFYAVCMRG